MDRFADEQPVILDDYVEYGAEQGRAEATADGVAMARAMVLEVFRARGVSLTDAQHGAVESETSVDRLRALHRAALTASSAEEALETREAPIPLRRAASSELVVIDDLVRYGFDQGLEE